MIIEIIQIHDASEAVKQIGLAATIVVLLLIAAGIAARYLWKYFTQRLDKKDAYVEELHKTCHADQLRMIESRREDLLNLERTLQTNTRSQERIVDALTSLANELKRRD